MAPAAQLGKRVPTPQRHTIAAAASPAVPQTGPTKRVEPRLGWSRTRPRVRPCPCIILSSWSAWCGSTPGWTTFAASGHLMASGSLYSVLPLARSALEAFAYARWTWKPALVQELRVNRALLDHKSTLAQEKKRLEGLLKITKRDGNNHHHVARVESDIAISRDRYTSACHDLRMVETYINQMHGAESVQTRPSGTKAVSALLAKATQSRSMDAIYGEFSELVHPQPSGIMSLLPESRIPHISLGNFLMPIHASMLGLEQEEHQEIMNMLEAFDLTGSFRDAGECLDDIAACWGLPEPWQSRSDSSRSSTLSGVDALAATSRRMSGSPGWTRRYDGRTSAG